MTTSSRFFDTSSTPRLVLYIGPHLHDKKKKTNRPLAFGILLRQKTEVEAYNSYSFPIKPGEYEYKLK